MLVFDGAERFINSSVWLDVMEQKFRPFMLKRVHCMISLRANI